MRAIRTEKPDLVTLDLVMPHKTGEKLYWELRKDEDYKKLPIVIITGYGKADAPTVTFHSFIEEKGVPEPDAFLEKPVDPRVTIDTAIKVLAERIPMRR